MKISAHYVDCRVKGNIGISTVYIATNTDKCDDILGTFPIFDVIFLIFILSLSADNKQYALCTWLTLGHSVRSLKGHCVRYFVFVTQFIEFTFFNMILMNCKLISHRNTNQHDGVSVSEEFYQYTHNSLLEDNGRNISAIVATTFTASSSRNGKNNFS